MQTALFNKYVWLVQTIAAHRLTREEINRRWSNSALNDNHETEIPKTTFFRYVQDIERMFGLRIVCNRNTGCYHIKGDGSTDGMRAWILDSFAVNNLLSEGKDLKDRIMFEEIPSGHEYLTTIISAMKDNTVLRMEYQKFRSAESDHYHIEPYCLKAFHQRWYLYCRRVEDGQFRTYALDRIHSLEETDKTFRIPKQFNPAAVYYNAFGVTAGSDYKVEDVRIRLYNGEGKYIESLPLHHSQQIVARTDEYSEFTFRLFVTPDFKIELKKYIPYIEILAPLSLRKEFYEAAVRNQNLNSV